MRQLVCNLTIRCLIRALRMRFTTVNFDGLTIGHFAEQADNKGYILVLDRKKK